MWLSFPSEKTPFTLHLAGRMTSSSVPHRRWLSWKKAEPVVKLFQGRGETCPQHFWTNSAQCEHLPEEDLQSMHSCPAPLRPSGQKERKTGSTCPCLASQCHHSSVPTAPTESLLSSHWINSKSKCEEEHSFLCS